MTVNRTRRALRALRHAGLSGAVTLGTLGITAGGADAQPGFPVPSCKWAGPAFVSRSLHVSLQAPTATWSTEIAPVLRCAYDERHGKLAPSGAPLVTIDFRELQHFKRPRGWQPVAHLGGCVDRRTCASPGRPAWALVKRTADKAKPYAKPAVSSVSLDVQDGLNCIIIAVKNPGGPLPVADELGAAIKLAKRLLPAFHWA